jgi:hypothetical protein
VRQRAGRAVQPARARPGGCGGFARRSSLRNTGVRAPPGVSRRQDASKVVQGPARPQIGPAVIPRVRGCHILGLLLAKGESTMTETEWLEGTDPTPMLEFLDGKVSTRWFAAAAHFAARLPTLWRKPPAEPAAGQPARPCAARPYTILTQTPDSGRDKMRAAASASPPPGPLAERT